MSSLPASIRKIRSKTTEKRWRHRFSHYKSMGAFCCHGNHSFDLICPKTLCSLSPTPVMLHIKFDLGWPAGFRDIQVWKCGQRRRRTDDGPLLYYKLTLWAFGSGELKTDLLIIHKLNLRSSHFSNIHMGHGNPWPETELVRAFMPVLVNSKFDDDSIKNEDTIFPLHV